MSFVGLYTGLSGIRASQTGIDTVSHNVANANTPGYTRQRVELTPAHSYQSPAGKIGTGVQVEDIHRLRDQFLDDRFRAAVADGEQAGVRADFLSSLEELTGEPDEGVSMRLDRLWDAMETWSNDPDDNASRTQVLTEIASVAEASRITADGWGRLANDYSERRDTVIEQANAKLAEIHDLDRRIGNADPSRIGPELLDQRDMLVDDLASTVGVEGRIAEDGTVELTLDGQQINGFDEPAELSLDGGEVQLTADGDTTEVTGAVGGELSGIQAALTEDLPQWRGELDDFAAGFADALNGVNEDAGGDALVGFEDPGDIAGTIVLASEDPDVLVASVDGPGAPPHDATNAENFADLRTEAVAFPDGGQRTIADRFADLSVGLGGAVNSELTRAEGAANVAMGAQLARDAEHGVSLDEEMVDLVRYQRSLESSSRVMTTVDEALDTLINRTGLVGR